MFHVKNKHENKVEVCGFKPHADINASVNILVAASLTETLNACGEEVRLNQLRLDKQTSEKQELSCGGNYVPCNTEDALRNQRTCVTI